MTQKQFTVRLRFPEYWALERMSYCMGLSKNTIINGLIAERYERYHPGGDISPANADLLRIGPDFYDDQRLHADAQRNIGKDDMRILIKAIDYILEGAEEWSYPMPEKIKELEFTREELAQIYSNM